MGKSQIHENLLFTAVLFATFTSKNHRQLKHFPNWNKNPRINFHGPFPKLGRMFECELKLVLSRSTTN